MPLVRLPTELMYMIAASLDCQRDINSLARSSRKLYAILNPYLYRHNSTQHKSSALIWAAKHGKKATICKCIEEGGNVETTEDGGKTPLYLAVENGHADVVESLLQADAKVNGRSRKGETALHAASIRDRANVVDLLLQERDVDVNAPKDSGFTPLHFACILGHIEVAIRLLADKRVNVNAPDYNAVTPLHRAVFEDNTAMVKLLIKDPRIEVNQADTLHGDTALHISSFYGLTESTSILLEHEKVHVNSRNKAKRTPLHLAAHSRKTAVVELLLRQTKVDFNALDLNGLDPIGMAQKSGDMNIVNLLQAKRDSSSKLDLQ